MIISEREHLRDAGTYRIDEEKERERETEQREQIAQLCKTQRQLDALNDLKVVAQLSSCRSTLSLYGFVVLSVSAEQPGGNTDGIFRPLDAGTIGTNGGGGRAHDSPCFLLRIVCMLLLSSNERERLAVPCAFP